MQERLKNALTAIGFCMLALVMTSVFATTVKAETNAELKNRVYEDAYSARTAHPFQRNGAPFRFKLSKAQQVD